MEVIASLSSLKYSFIGLAWGLKQNSNWEIYLIAYSSTIVSIFGVRITNTRENCFAPPHHDMQMEKSKPTKSQPHNSWKQHKKAFSGSKPAKQKLRKHSVASSNRHKPTKAKSKPEKIWVKCKLQSSKASIYILLRGSFKQLENQITQKGH